MKHKPPKVAIVHDWLYGGGAERVVLALHRMFPDAPIYTSYCSPEWRERLDGKVVTGYLQRWPFSHLRKFLPYLRQRWFAGLDVSAYDLVISSAGNGEAKFVRVDQERHICYCHTPTHFYWRHYEQYVRQPGFRPYWLVRGALRWLVGPLRRRDYQAAQRVGTFVANSTHIQADIKQFYDREATVVHPPVDVTRFAAVTLPKQRRDFVTVGRQTPYKRQDVLIAACNQLKLPLLVIGNGPEHDRLQQLAGETITFRTDVQDEELPKLVAGAEGFLFAALEDFGIAPVEAMAAGTPVLAYEAGGALDYVVPKKTGWFFAEQTVESLVPALEAFQAQQWDYGAIRNHAAQFSEERFVRELQAVLAQVTDQS